MGLYYIWILALWDSMGLSENEDLTINYMMFPVDLVNMFEKISIFANIGWLPTITS